MFHAVTKQVSGTSRYLNFLAMGDGYFLQRQVERRGDLVFMRAKKRMV